MPSNQGPRRPLTVFFSAGEPSGDLHGANLIRALKHRHGEVEAIGFGGPQMAAAGCRLHAELTLLAVMGLVRAILNLHKFYAHYRRALRTFRENRPDAVVLIDFPGFNWWIARAAKRLGIPVFYFVPPQIWAWARWRVKKMRARVDHVLCSLPFEQAWYAERGCHATHIGHPFFDEMPRQRLDDDFVAGFRNDPRPLVAILPGSRTQEVVHNTKALLRAAKQVLAAVPEARFAVAAFKASHAEMVAREAAAANLTVNIHVGKTPELIHAANCCMAVSGSVSLELLYRTKPTVIVYQISRLMHLAQKVLRKVKYITLVNLLAAKDAFDEDLTLYRADQRDADRVLFPEYLTCTDRSREIAGHIVGWLTDPERRAECVASLAELKARVCHPGATGNAADYLLKTLGVTTGRVPRPHFLARDTVGGASAEAA